MSIKEIKIGSIEDRTGVTQGFIAVNSYGGEVDWGNAESDGPQPTIDGAIATARRYDWDPPFFIAEVNIVAKVVE